MNAKTTNITSQINFGKVIKGWQISIDKMDITLSDDETIILTAMMLKKGLNIDLADLVPAGEQRDAIQNVLNNNL